MMSSPHSHWLIITAFLNYNIDELQVTSQVNVVPVSTAFAIVRYYGNKIYFKVIKYTDLCYAENVINLMFTSTVRVMGRLQ